MIFHYCSVLSVCLFVIASPSLRPLRFARTPPPHPPPPPPCSILARITEQTFKNGDLDHLESDELFGAPLDEHRLVMQSTRGDVQSAAALDSTLSLLRTIRSGNEHDVLRLMETPGGQPGQGGGLHEAVDLIRRLSVIYTSLFETTVEEEKSSHEERQVVEEKLERNLREKQSLEGMLAMERDERAKECEELDRLEDRLAADTALVMGKFKHTMAETEEMDRSEQEADALRLDAEMATLKKERDDLADKLAKMRDRHAQEETQDKQKKVQALNFLEDSLRDYDTSMLEKHQQHEAHKTAADRIEKKMSDMTMRVTEMKAERADFEEKERLRAIHELGDEMKQWRLDKATDVINEWWGPLFAAKNKKGKKGKGKK